MISERQCQRYCYEPLWMIKGYEEAIKSSEKWDCHHQVETIMNCSRKDLIAKGCYYHRPAHELVFLPRTEHKRIHKLGNKIWLGRHLSEVTKEKIRIAKLGNKIWLGKHHSEDTKEKLRQANSGENGSTYGMHWWNNGKEEILTTECPGPDWKLGRRLSEGSNEKNRQSHLGKNNAVYGAHWWNDGKSEILRTECPGADWKRGRLRTGE